ncbi:unnamed protein product [Cuscuta campestris]|uniref:Uncharacterized protein n=1 Tax=Cuscuta campestris TaxID=132261 RepID=A0A484L4A0_9ASTE|nr:unnamed protein product [Cuscuta campestris]
MDGIGALFLGIPVNNRTSSFSDLSADHQLWSRTVRRSPRLAADLSLSNLLADRDSSSRRSVRRSLSLIVKVDCYYPSVWSSHA